MTYDFSLLAQINQATAPVIKPQGSYKSARDCKQAYKEPVYELLPKTGGMGTDQIMKALGIAKSTVHTALLTLEAEKRIKSTGERVNGFLQWRRK